MNLKFRPATEHDFAKVAQLVASADELLLISPSSQFPWTAEQVKAIAGTRLHNTVAIDGDSQTIIGYANIYKAMSNQTAFIGNVIIAPNYRQHGVGKQLMQYMMEICQHQWYATPQVSVFNHNTDGLRFYHQLGFVPFAMEQREYGVKKLMLIHLKFIKKFVI